MAYYHTCPDCGAHLDSGEHCDCKENALVRRARSDEGAGNAVLHQSNFKITRFCAAVKEAQL